MLTSRSLQRTRTKNKASVAPPPATEENPKGHRRSRGCRQSARTCRRSRQGSPLRRTLSLARQPSNTPRQGRSMWQENNIRNQGEWLLAPGRRCRRRKSTRSSCPRIRIRNPPPSRHRRRIRHIRQLCNTRKASRTFRPRIPRRS